MVRKKLSNFQKNNVKFNAEQHLRTIKLNDFPTSFDVSYYEDMLIVGTQNGRVDILDYFTGKVIDYQILHSSKVRAVELVHKPKEKKLASEFIYASEIDDPRNKQMNLTHIVTIGDEEMLFTAYKCPEKAK